MLSEVKENITLDALNSAIANGVAAAYWYGECLRWNSPVAS